MKKVLVALLVLFVVVTVVGFFLPSEWSVEREIAIPSERAKVEAVLLDEVRWPEWWPHWTQATADGTDLKFAPKGEGLRWEEGGKEGVLRVERNGDDLAVHVEIGTGREDAVIELEPAADGEGTIVRWRTGMSFGWNPWQRYLGPSGQVQEVIAENLERALAALATRVALPQPEDPAEDPAGGSAGDPAGASKNG